MFIHFWERETERERGRGRGIQRHRIWSRLQALSCQHRARHGARTHGPWDHNLSQSQTLNQPSHPGTPIYFFERQKDRDTERKGGGAERGGDTESKAGFRLLAVSTEPDMGLEPTDHEIMTWAKVGCLTDWATQAPLIFPICKHCLGL